MKIYKYLLMLAVGFAMCGCYNTFDEVRPMVKYMTQEDFEKAHPDCIYKTIEDLKQIYAEKTGDTTFVGGENSGWNNTKYYQFEEDYYFKGKVISNDEEGNIYKSLYLLDETGAIEVRLTSGNYLKYYMGEINWEESPIEIPSTYIYVRVKDLYIGNYRMMLSIGAGPTDSFNKRDEHKFYANSAIDDLRVIADHVFVGEDTTLIEGIDIPVINESNHGTINGEAGREMLGRLILFRGITCLYAGVADQEGKQISGIGDNIYPSWLYTENMAYANGILTKPWYNFAYSVNSKCLYGSVLYTYQSAVSSGIVSGAYSLRTSGYSRFAGRPVTKNGAKGDILAIYSIYSKSWTYQYGAYQLAVSHYNDINFNERDFLTSEQVDAMTPDGGDGTYLLSNTATGSILAYNIDAEAFANITDYETAIVYPTFFTHYEDGNSGFDKFVNYPSFGATDSAIVVEYDSKYYALKVVDDAVTTVEVTVADNCIETDPDMAFNICNVGKGIYAFAFGDKYLAVKYGELVLDETIQTWKISKNGYNSEKDSYYVPWVGEEDDEGSGSND